MNIIGWDRATNKEFIENDDLPSPQNLLFSIFRAEKFSGSAVREMIDRGVILLILERLEQLYKEYKF